MILFNEEVTDKMCKFVDINYQEIYVLLEKQTLLLIKTISFCFYKLFFKNTPPNMHAQFSKKKNIFTFPASMNSCFIKELEVNCRKYHTKLNTSLESSSFDVVEFSDCELRTKYI